MSIYSSSHLIGQYEDDMAASNNPATKEHKTTMDQDAFLTILVAQLTNQDPMNPMEDKEMTSQLAEFSSLEQLTNINTNIKAMGADDEYQQMLAATSFIGKSVKAQGYNLSKEGDAVSTLHYGLGETVNNLRMNIYDQSGDMVSSIDLGSKQAGSYQYTWDGRDANGKELPDGSYSVAMVAEDVNGEPVLVQTEVAGEVTGVVSENGEYYLRLADGRFVNFANVIEVVKGAQDSGDGSGDDSGDDPTPEPDPEENPDPEEIPDQPYMQGGQGLEFSTPNTVNFLL